MKEDNNIDDLKELVNEYNRKAKTRGILSKQQREIRVYEEEMCSNMLFITYHTNLSELAAGEDAPLGPHGYKISSYSLTWRPRPNTQTDFRFYLTNELANKTVELFKCPDYLQQKCLDLMGNFIDKLIKKANLPN